MNKGQSVVVIVVVALLALNLGTLLGRSADAQAPAGPVDPVGRYQIAASGDQMSHLAWLIDTSTGDLWMVEEIVGSARSQEPPPGSHYTYLGRRRP